MQPDSGRERGDLVPRSRHAWLPPHPALLIHGSNLGNGSGTKLGVCIFIYNSIVVFIMKYNVSG